MKKFTGLFIAIVILISGCASKIESIPSITSTPSASIDLNQQEPTNSPTITKRPTSTVTLVPTETPIEISSPLDDYSLDILIDMISNPFYPPVKGSDDPHQGVDFSVVDPENVIALKGSPVSSILKGEVVMVMNNRFPYGNAIMIETSVNDLPQSWQSRLKGLATPERWGITTNLSCPDGWDESISESEKLSLFVLYAHMDEISEIQADQIVESGEMLGNIGDSGNALAPHLHVEMRLGFSESITGSMAHYDVTANQEEMSNYCKWRVSGLFQLVDPMVLLLTHP